MFARTDDHIAFFVLYAAFECRIVAFSGTGRKNDLRPVRAEQFRDRFRRAVDVFTNGQLSHVPKRASSRHCQDISFGTSRNVFVALAEFFDEVKETVFRYGRAYAVHKMREIRDVMQ